MKRLIKYGLWVVGCFVVLVAAALIIIPRVVNIQKYKPEIAEKISAATGRPVTLGGPLHLSLFPWIGVSFSDFHLGNPPGFARKDFVTIASFEAHLRLLPLLTKKVEIDRFVLNGPEIDLERQKDGRTNWQGIGAQKQKAPAGAEKKEAAPAAGGPAKISLKSLAIGEFSINNGRIHYLDKQHNEQQDISGLSLQLKDVSLVRPISVSFKALINGQPLGMTGRIGPLGQNPGQGILPLDLNFTAPGNLKAHLAGQLDQPAGALAYSLTLDVPQFSPRQLMAALKVSLPIKPSDPKALEAVALAMKIKGSKKQLAISDGRLMLDGSRLQFSGDARRLAPLDLVFNGNLDQLNLDRYLPAKAEKKAGTTKAGVQQQLKTAQVQKRVQPQETKKIDYSPLRKLTLDTTLAVGKLKVQGLQMENIKLHLTAKDGVFRFEPLAMDLYKGTFVSSGTMNVQGSAPQIAMDANGAGIKVGPLLEDLLGKELMEGTLKTRISLKMVGDTSGAIKRTLNGQGNLLFTDGAIMGIDLAGMVRNVQASFTGAKVPTQKPKTDFSELNAPFTIRNGLVNTSQTTLQSPLIRVVATGSADLVSQALDMRVTPKFVATLKGQGDTQQHKGLMVPVLVKGTFNSPEFSPDLAGMIKQQLPSTETLKKTLQQQIAPGNKKKPSLKKSLEGLLPKL